jgi:hypothetical protein
VWFVQVLKAEEQRKLEQDVRTLYVRFIKTFPTSHEEIKVRCWLCCTLSACGTVA